MGEARLEDDGGPGVFAVEEAEVPGSLFVRVGPVYDNFDVRKEPGIWIEYMPEHMNSGYQGPLLLTPKVWRELVRAVDSRLQRRGKFGWPRRWRP